MSKGQSSIAAIVITAFVTSAVLVGGWLGASRYFGQQTISASEDEVPAAAEAPRRRTARVRPSGSGRGEPQVDLSSTDAAQTGAVAVDNEASGAPLENEAFNIAENVAVAPLAEAEPAGGLLSAALDAIAPSTTTDARTIMEEAQRRAEAPTYRYDGLLQSFDAKGKATEKRWTFDRVGSNGRSKAVLKFTAPAEVDGVALLIHNHPERASDQWMWTPSLQRDRRIALQDRSTRFFGTDFSFEDLEERDVDQYDYSMLGNEDIAGVACWKIQMTPKKSRSSHYTRSIAWIRQDNYVMVRLDNFVNDDVVKRLTNSTIENIQGIWTARQLEMADLRRGTRTRLTLQEVTYQAPMKERDFTLQAISR